MCIGEICRTSSITSHIAYSLESDCPLIIEITSNWSCPINNYWSFYPIITNLVRMCMGMMSRTSAIISHIACVIVFDHHQFRQYHMLMGRISWSSSITNHVILVTPHLYPSKWPKLYQQCPLSKFAWRTTNYQNTYQKNRTGVFCDIYGSCVMI